MQLFEQSIDCLYHGTLQSQLETNMELICQKWDLYYAEALNSIKRGSRYLSRGWGVGGGGCSHRKRTHLIIRYFDFRISMDVSLLQEKSTFPVLTMRMSPHLEPFFFFNL